jgi:hypothetical protein
VAGVGLESRTMNVRAILFVIAVVIMFTVWNALEIGVSEDDARRIGETVENWIRGS